MEITDLSAVAEKHGAVQTITLPGWGGDDAFICKAKRPSLFNMAATGLIPNPLLNTVQQLFTADALLPDSFCAMYRSTFFHFARASGSWTPVLSRAESTDFASSSDDISPCVFSYST